MKKINIVIPMAGEGIRFKNAGYITPKPFIKIFDKTMLEHVIENVHTDLYDIEYILIYRKKHVLGFEKKIENLHKKYNITELAIDHLTEGPACTVLLAKEKINNLVPLFIINCDQELVWDRNDFYLKSLQNIDGCIITTNSNRKDYSYAKVNEDNIVVQTAEKKVISNNATVGYYFWKNGKDFVTSAESMIQKNIRTNNEFYVCPVYNEFITLNKKVTIYEIEKMWCLGTPEDLEKYIKVKNDNK